MSKARKWFYGLASSVITAVANAGLTFLGITGTNAIFNTEIKLEPRAFLIQCGISGLVGAFLFFQKSPLPPISDTAPPFPPES